MKNIVIEVKYGLTENVGDYSNVRPEVSIRAEFEALDEDGLLEQAGALIETARALVQEQADAALERHDREAIYDTDSARYRVWYSNERKVVVICPDGKELPTWENWRRKENWFSLCRAKLRGPASMDCALAAYRDRPGFQLIDMDFKALPDVIDEDGPEPRWHALKLHKLGNYVTSGEGLKELEALQILGWMTPEFVAEVEAHARAKYLSQADARLILKNGPDYLEKLRKRDDQQVLLDDDEDEDFDDEDDEDDEDL